MIKTPTWLKTHAETLFGKNQTIFKNLIIGLVIAVSISSVAVSLIHLCMLVVQEKRIYETKADEYIHYLQNSLEQPIWTFDESMVEKICDSFLKNDVIAQLRIINAKGDLLFDKQKSGDSKHLLEKQDEIFHKGLIIGTVGITLTLKPYRDNMFRLLRSNLIMMLVTIALIIAATKILLTLYLHKPMDYLMDRIGRIAKGDFEYAHHKYKQLEIQMIISEFNHMAKEVKKREKTLYDLNQTLEQEIRDRRYAEEQVRDSKSRLAQIVNFLPDPTYVIDIEGHVIAWNRAIEHLTGVLAADILGQGDYAYSVPFHGERRPALIDRVRFRNSETDPAYGYPIEKKGDVLISEIQNAAFKTEDSYFWNAASPLYDDEGEVIGAIETIRDITEKKLAEKALRNSQIRFRSFFDSSPDGVILTNFERKIMDVSKSLLRMTGFRHSELLKRNIEELMPSMYHEVISKAMHLIEKGIASDIPIEIEYLKIDGALISGLVRIWVVTDEKSKPIALGAFIKDISQEKAMSQEKSLLEKQLRHTQKMEAIGTLAGGIAHDFNNILAGMNGYAELAMMKLPSENESLKKYVTRILEGGNRAKELVRQILQFSRQDGQPLGFIGIRPVIKEAVKLLRSTIPKTIAIHEHITAKWDSVLADATQIHQVMMNLCTNAYHAMRDTGGTLTIRLENETLTSPKRSQSCEIPPGDYVKLIISDTGTGIPANIRDRIFDPFYTTKNVNEGTGLGLSVTLGIVIKHAGLIELDTLVAGGTTFGVWLPVSKESCPPLQKTDVPFPLGNHERILLVDDESFFLDVLREHLERLDYTVTDSQSSPTALKLFTANPDAFDLILTDQTMPEMTGIQLVSEIRKWNADIPVILCTGYSEHVTEETAAQYGISKFLSKPVSLRVVADEVSALLKANIIIS